MKENIIEFEHKLIALLAASSKLLEWCDYDLQHSKLSTLGKAINRKAFNEISLIRENKDFDFENAVWITLWLTKDFIKCQQKIVENKISISQIAEPEYWENGEHLIEAAIIFSYSIFVEAFGDELSNELEKLSSLDSDTLLNIIS